MGTNLNKRDFIYPYFVVTGSGRKEAIPSFPGQYRFSADLLIEDIKELSVLGVDKILLFGIPDSKDGAGSMAYKDDNIVNVAVRRIKKYFPGVTVFTDVCLCSYTDHGHCGVINKGAIDGKATLEALSKIALSHAGSGADYVAPSAMAKGQVLTIRKALDKNGYKNTKIMG